MIDRTDGLVLLNDASNINPVYFTILCIFPIALFLLLFFKSKILKKGEFDEKCWGIEDSKALQVFAAFGVLIHHLTGAATRYGDLYKGPVTVMSYVGILFTSIFFFFSGFGLIISYRTKENYLKGFLWNKFNAVVIPFMLANLLYIIIGLADVRIYDPLTFFTSLFGITLINTNAWYLVELIILYIVFYFAFSKIKDEKKAVSVMVLTCLVMTAIGFLLKHDYTQINGHWFRGEWWFNTTMMFAVGMIIGRSRDKVYDLIKGNYTAAAVISVVAVAVTGIFENYAREKFSYYAETYTYSGYYEKAVTYISQTLLCISFLSLVLIICMKVKFGNSALSFLAPLTLEIYLIQDMCMTNFGYEEIAPDYLIYAVTIFMTVVAAIILNKLVGLIRKYINDIKSGQHKAPDLLFEKKAILKKEKAVVQGIIFFYAVSFAALILFTGLYVKNSVTEAGRLEADIAKLNESKLFDEVIYGTFESNYKTDGEEPFEWYVISKEDDKVLLLSKYIITPVCYNRTHENVTYNDSYIRDIITNEGTYDVFSRQELKHLTVDPSTGDTVFLIGKDEIDRYEIPVEILTAKGTYNAIEYTGLYRDVNRDDNTWWWLRNNDSVIEATVVNSRGEVVPEGQEVNRVAGGLRPAVWVKIK